MNRLNENNMTCHTNFWFKTGVLFQVPIKQLNKEFQMLHVRKQDFKGKLMSQ